MQMESHVILLGHTWIVQKPTYPDDVNNHSFLFIQIANQGYHRSHSGSASSSSGSSRGSSSSNSLEAAVDTAGAGCGG
jgi:hypothetical protein